MSQQILKVRPTKIELIRLKRRIKVARRLHKVLKDRLIILSQELISLIKEGAELRQTIHERLRKCETLLADTSLLASPLMVRSYSEGRIRKAEVVIGTRVVAGVRVPVTDLEVEPGELRPEPYPLTLQEAGKCYGGLMKDVLRLAEIEASILLIGKEVSRVRRRVNALENILIPRIEATIKYLTMKFEEREREDKTRMKKVKQLLERRGK
ncbi:MAG: V-type ATP synthase subunit D [Desulfurococcales archaeon]|nr:V-type ATP synthase subunit D [Desulfurococcales archaeon]